MKYLLMLVGFCIAFQSYATTSVNAPKGASYCENGGDWYEVGTVIDKGEQQFVCHRSVKNQTARWQPFKLLKE
ncbi:hypothetical protein VMF7928_02277 [Vibrio marisflavi CECT 7928]|uniref:DUF1496 domain-containing protein n=2 Tax=Vibrio marisflavi TaxID=1216040 RepID=A0ABN8E5Y3_9VIBR|nr:hypothetical protein VMF7928_02277 [Vibrio marisflavi CECT 7928]